MVKIALRLIIWLIGFRWLLSIMMRADAVEVLSVQIEADTSDLIDALEKEIPKAAKKAADGVGKLGDELSKTEGEAEKFGKSSEAAADGVDDLGDSAARTSKKVREYVEVINSAGKKIKAYRDVNGKLRDETGKFVKEADGGAKSVFKFGAALGAAGNIGSRLVDVIVNLAAKAGQALVGLAQDTIQVNDQFETFGVQFETLLGSSSLAQEKLKALEQFGVETPFELPEIVEASKALEIAGGAALNTDETLRLVGDAASAANTEFAGVALWTGRMYDSLQGGKPFGDASARLNELGILSNKTRTKMEEMQKAGVDGNKIFELFAEEGLGRFAGGMDKLTKTFSGVMSNLADFKGQLLRLGGAPFFEAVKESAQSFLEVLNQNSEGLIKIGTGMGEIGAVLVEFFKDDIASELNVEGFIESIQSVVEWIKSTVVAFLNVIKIAKVFGQQLVNLYEPAFKFQAKFVLGLAGLIAKFSIFGIAAKRIGEEGGVMATLQKAFTAGAQAVAIISAGIKGLIGLFDPLIQSFAAGGDVIKALFAGDIVGAMDAAKRSMAAVKDGVLDTEGGFDAFKTSILASNEAINKTTKSTKKLKKETEGLGDIKDDEEDAIVGPAVDTAAQKKLASFSDQFIDATENRNKQLEALETSHANNIKSIAERAVKQRLDIEQKANKALIDNDKESEKQRLKIIDDARKNLAKLAKDTDAQIEEKRGSFQKDELRDTEDHMRDMRKLTEKFLNDLEGAVRARDAGAIVDLQRNFNAEKSEREEDFNIKRSRGKSDQNEELSGLRKAESDKREEILTSQAEQLSNLQLSQDERRTKILEDKDMALAALEAKLVEDLTKENENYMARQAQLDEALQKRLESIAESMAKEKDITEEGARAILETLQETFGVGGDIDEMMEKFAARRSLKAEIDISFKRKSGITEESEATPLTSSQAARLSGKSGLVNGGRKRIGGIQEFAEGGTLVANTPTLAMFGEAGPEIAQFTPLSDLSSGGGSSKVEVEFSGSAPPGIGATDRDKIAGVVVSALRETGVLS